MHIRFLVDQTYETGGPGVGPKFAAGRVLAADEVAEALDAKSPLTDDFIISFLNRWVQRGVAVWADDAEASEEPADDEVDLTKLTRAELDALAAERGIDVSEARNKGDVIAALEAAEGV